MGRLFARYLRDSVRELFLIDHFGVGPRPANLSKTLEEVASGPGELPSDTRVFAGRPGDAAEYLPRADVTLLALGFEDVESFAETVRFYVPWLRPGSLPVREIRRPDQQHGGGRQQRYHGHSEKDRR